MESRRDKMIPFDRFKKLLGAAADGLSDAEIEHIRDLQHRLADIIFDVWLRERNSQAGFADSQEF